ncbi:O-antigen ligase family protein [Candidatus Desantisbacteria bacterium]|nr:O-antigen ligase family protein [Candidatus Desantisbacteria bacterium]
MQAKKQISKPYDHFNKVIALLLSLLIFIVPLFFGLNMNSLDIQKFACFHTLLIIILWCWIAMIVFSSEIRLNWNPLCSLVLVYLTVNITATVCSVNPWISFLGFYGHHEGLLSLISYFLLFFITINFINRARIPWVLNAITLSCVVAGAYGVIQRLGLDPVKWELFNAGRCPATFGNPIGLGNYLSFGLIFGFCLYLFSLINKPPVQKKVKGTQKTAVIPPPSIPYQNLKIIYPVFLILMYLGFCTSQTRASYLGLFGGLVLICGLFWKAFLKKEVLAVAGIILLITIGFNLNPETSMFLRFQQAVSEVATKVTQPKQSPQEKNEGQPTGPARFFIWKSVSNIVKANPILGTGLDTLGIVYPQYKSIESARAEGAYAVAASAHNELLDIAVSSGLSGIFSYLCLLVFLCILWVKAYRAFPDQSEQKLYLCAIGGGIVAHLIQNQFSPTGIADSCAFWVMLGLMVSSTTDKPRIIKLNWLNDGLIKILIIVIAIAGGIAFWIYMVIRPCIADFNYEQGTLLQGNTEMEQQAVYRFERAVNYNPHEIQYMRELAAFYINKAQVNPQKEILETSIKQAQNLIKFNPYDAVGHCIIGASYYLLNKINEASLSQALAPYQQAIKVDPLNPDPHNCLGLVYLEMKDYRKATNEFREALKTDLSYSVAVNNLHRTYLEQGNIAEAISAYKELLKINSSIGSVPLREKLVDAYLRLGKQIEAKKECEAIKRLDPGNAVAKQVLR